MRSEPLDADTDGRRQVHRLRVIAVLMIGIMSLTGCSAASNQSSSQSSSQLASTNTPAAVEARRPRTVLKRSEVISVTATPEDVVSVYLAASNRGDGAVLNALLGKNGSKVNGDVASSSPSLGGINIHAATGKNPAVAADVAVDLRVLSANNYFGLEPGPATIRFVLIRGDDGFWYVSTISGHQR